MVLPRRRPTPTGWPALTTPPPPRSSPRSPPARSGDRSSRNSCRSNTTGGTSGIRPVHVTVLEISGLPKNAPNTTKWRRRCAAQPMRRSRWPNKHHHRRIVVAHQRDVAGAAECRIVAEQAGDQPHLVHRSIHHRCVTVDFERQPVKPAQVHPRQQDVLAGEVLSQRHEAGSAALRDGLQRDLVVVAAGHEFDGRVEHRRRQITLPAAGPPHVEMGDLQRFLRRVHGASESTGLTLEHRLPMCAVSEPSPGTAQNTRIQSMIMSAG